MASSEKYPLSKLNKWNLTDKPHMDDYNYDNRLLDETGMWKAAYDPRGLERDAFLSQTVFEETAVSTAGARVASMPGVASWAEITKIPFSVKANTAGTSGPATLDIAGENGVLLGAKPLYFPETGGNGLSAAAPTGWVREGGVYQLVYNGVQIVVSNTQMRQASTAAPGIVRLSNATNSATSATAATSKAVKDAYDLAARATTDIQSIVEEMVLARSQREHPVGSYYISINATNPASIFGFGTWALTNLGQALVGVNTGDTDFATPGKAGGAKTVALAVANLPSHLHASTGLAATVASGGAHAHAAGCGYVTNDHTHSVGGTTSTAGGHRHNNRTHGTGYFEGKSSGTSTQRIAQNGSSWVDVMDTQGDHAHTWSATTGGINSNHYHAISVVSAGAHAHTATMAGNTAYTGSGTAHSNLQPYQTAYIWKRTA